MWVAIRSHHWHFTTSQEGGCYRRVSQVHGEEEGACGNSNGYYGEYISGLFQTALPANMSIIAAWGDSREGCVQQGLPTVHQHVWSGATRSKDFTPPPTCGLDGQECCASRPACTDNLVCHNGFCVPSFDRCGDCENVRARCLSACSDGSCSPCDCDNELCRCETTRGCNLRCSVQRCEETP